MGHEALLMDILIDSSVVPHYVSYAFLASIILIAVALIIRGSMLLVPRGMQNALEVLLDSLLDLVEVNIGPKWGVRTFPLISTIFMYVIVCNYMGLIPGFSSPTSNINVTASIAVPVFLLTHAYGLIIHKFGYIKHFLGPMRNLPGIPLMILLFFVEGIGHLVRPVTLSVRLFGNMFAKHVLLGVLAMLTPFLVPVLVLGLGTLVGLIQAFVFSLLATLYLAGAVEEAH